MIRPHRVGRQCAVGNPKSEYRNPKQITKFEFRNLEVPTRYSFEFRISSLFRISIFGFRVSGLVSLEELHRPLMLLGRFERVERAEVAALAGLGIDLP